MEGFYQSQSDKAFVRCCDDSKEKTGGQCHSSAVWTSTWAMCDSNDVTNDDEEYKCPSGFTAISHDLDGEGKMWIPPRLLVDLGGPIESACASACTEFHPIEMGVP